MGALFLLGCRRRCSGRSSTPSCRSICTRDELVGGNALIEAGTFVAILIGTLAGGLLAGAVANIRCGSLSAACWSRWLGYLTSRGIPPPAPAPILG
jgi:hypothetical protein